MLRLLVLRRYGYGPPPVHYVGKTATFILLVAFPVLLLAAACRPARRTRARTPIGWALAWWGLVLYWVAGVLLPRSRSSAADRAARPDGTA